MKDNESDANKDKSNALEIPRKKITLDYDEPNSEFK